MMFKLCIAHLVAFFTRKPSAFARVAELQVELNKETVVDARALLIATEEAAVANTAATIDKLKSRADAASTSESEAQAEREAALSTFDTTTDRRIAAIEERLRALKARRASLRTALLSKQADERAAAVRENNAINASLAALAIELSELVSQKDTDEGIAESL